MNKQIQTFIYYRCFLWFFPFNPIQSKMYVQSMVLYITWLHDFNSTRLTTYLNRFLSKFIQWMGPIRFVINESSFDRIFGHLPKIDIQSFWTSYINKTQYVILFCDFFLYFRNSGFFLFCFNVIYIWISSTTMQLVYYDF